MMQVRTDDNEILDAILEVSNKWDASPIVWVKDMPYKIKLVHRTERYVVLYQYAINYKYSNTGKETYRPIAKRQVKLMF
jgi:hypothetical protein